MTIVEPAPAKINLALHVRSRRPDGYHEIETLFAFLRHGDTVSVTPGAAGLVITGPFAGQLRGEGDNLVTRALNIFAQSIGLQRSISLTLDKHLPIASGIGGGSADAAATLRALARLHDVAPDDPRLIASAAALGSDVPACLLGRTAFGTGRGERLRPLDGLAGTPVLLVNPGVAVSTAAVFRGWDGHDRGAMSDDLSGADLLSYARQGRNDLEAPARVIAPVIGDVLDRLAATGPLLSRMSGSGATCFALYTTEEARGAAARQLEQPGYWCLESTLA